MIDGISKKETSSEGTGISLLELPELCCRAIGGNPDHVTAITAAWSLLYTAAHLMDAVEDKDELETWYRDLGPPAIINAATGLYAVSTSSLMQLFNLDLAFHTALEILTEFQLTILNMCSGQHLDLISAELTLDQYWDVAESKSGSFFDLACFAGARIATDDPVVISGFREFGKHLGILIQISDDTKDVWSMFAEGDQTINKPACLLPIVYGMAVVSPEDRNKLASALRNEYLGTDSISIAREIVETSGAGLYLITKAEQHRLQAVRALESIGVDNHMYNKLVGILDQVSLLKKV